MSDCEEAPEGDHCFHERPFQGDSICCLCGDLFNPEDEGLEHGEYHPKHQLQEKPIENSLTARTVIATLTFPLPEKQYEFERAVKGAEAISCLNDIERFIRSTLKYDDKVTERERELLGKVREELPKWLWDLE